MPSPRPQVFPVLILGGGPAGLASALTFARTRTTALVLDSQTYRNDGATHMHTVLSRDHLAPEEFRKISQEQITSRYDTIHFENTTVVSAVKKQLLIAKAEGGGEGEEEYEGFEVTDTEGKKYQGKKLILATGSQDILPSIPGFAENWPQHIYQCLACDGYEQRGTAIGVLDNSAFVAHGVNSATAFDPRITVFTNGPMSEDESVKQQFRIAKTYGASIDERKIARLINNGPSHEDGVTVEFESGEPVTLGFLVARPRTVNRAQDLIEQLGVECMETPFGSVVKVENPMFNSTSVKGVFVAGDTMQLMKQVTLSMADGQKSAAGAGMELAGERAAAALRVLGEEKV